TVILQGSHNALSLDWARPCNMARAVTLSFELFPFSFVGVWGRVRFLRRRSLLLLLLLLLLRFIFTVKRLVDWRWLLWRAIRFLGQFFRPGVSSVGLDRRRLLCDRLLWLRLLPG